MNRTAIVATIAALTVMPLTACSSSPDLNDKQQQVADRLVNKGQKVDKDQAACIVDKVKGDDDILSSLGSDTDFSEATYPGASKVKSAYESCTGKNFSQEFGY